MGRKYLPPGHQWGWDKENEDEQLLDDTAGDIDELMQYRGDFEEQYVGDITQIVQNESQNSWPSCRGHSLATSIEWLHRIKNQTLYLNFSRQWCWVETQRKYRRPSRGAGATMVHGYQLAEEDGVCEEKSWPYPFPRYSSKPPDGAKENAAKWTIAKHYRVRTAEQVYEALLSGMAVIDLGIKWKSGMSRAGRTVETYSGGGGGGHAICLLACSNRRDKNGERYIWLVNSHGKRWGYNGSTEISPTCLRQILSHSYTTAAALTDLTVPKPRTWDFLKQKVVRSGGKSWKDTLIA